MMSDGSWLHVNSFRGVIGAGARRAGVEGCILMHSLFFFSLIVNNFETVLTTAAATL